MGKFISFELGHILDTKKTGEGYESSGGLIPVSSYVTRFEHKCVITNFETEAPSVGQKIVQVKCIHCGTYAKYAIWSDKAIVKFRLDSFLTTLLFIFIAAAFGYLYYFLGTKYFPPGTPRNWIKTLMDLFMLITVFPSLIMSLTSFGDIFKSDDELTIHSIPFEGGGNHIRANTKIIPQFKF